MSEVSREEYLSLMRELQLLKDRNEVENTFGLYQYNHCAINDMENMRSVFAQEHAGVSAEFGNSGVFVGLENISRYFEVRAGREPGKMICHTATTPVIEVARDGKTAKGLWISTGHVTTGLNPEWVWQRYAVDFIKESAGWRIWHLHTYELFRCPYNEDWVSYSEKRDKAAIVASNEKLDKPPAQRPSTGYWRYSPTAVTEDTPYPPKPYATWDETFSY